MTRNFKHWIEGYLAYTRESEAPAYVRVWCGLGAIAACLERKVWIDMMRFKWYPNNYIVLVAPPAVIQKSSAINDALKLVWAVPIEPLLYPPHRGPDITTWQALYEALLAVNVGVELVPGSGDISPMSAMTLAVSEMGNFLNTKDQDLVNLLITLWDCPDTLDKRTKYEGTKIIENCWLNLLAGTTPSWVAQSFNPNTLEGGFASRCIFVYCDEKAQLVAYPSKDARTRREHADLRKRLVEDLVEVCQIMGEYKITPEAQAWGQEWYAGMWKDGKPTGSFKGVYQARKQVHVHKVAMLLAACKGNSLVITLADLQEATALLEELEPLMQKVFSRIGEHDRSRLQADIIAEIAKAGELTLWELTQRIMRHIPDIVELNNFISTLRQSGQVDYVVGEKGVMVKYRHPQPGQPVPAPQPKGGPRWG